ncbi:hypothetical protein [Pseudoxanthomonas sp. UTMC 1351]|uniref:hypothetical protein n=1 Tax=Pseudoxanthomonas sp. UTMC 1351 TaxID=2695853 RepID=UPI0034CF9AA7
MWRIGIFPDFPPAGQDAPDGIAITAFLLAYFAQTRQPATCPFSRAVTDYAKFRICVDYPLLDRDGVRR